MTSLQAHRYNARIIWTGNIGDGTRDYRSYGRDYDVLIDGKPTLQGSADPAFRGDKAFYNPEELLLASLSSCHMLWYLHLCSDADIIVTSYADEAQGIMDMNADGSGQFREVVLRPQIVLATGEIDLARALHSDAHRKCFIARSVSFPVLCEPDISYE